MKYRVIVYIKRPLSLWTERTEDVDVIYDEEVPWLWFARMLGRSNWGNTGRCGFKILKGDIRLEQVDGPEPCFETP